MTHALAAVPLPEDCPTIPVEQAGAHLGISRDAAYKAAKRGDIPTLRIGRRLVVPVAPFRRMLGLDDSRPAA